MDSAGTHPELDAAQRETAAHARPLTHSRRGKWLAVPEQPSERLNTSGRLLQMQLSFPPPAEGKKKEEKKNPVPASLARSVRPV